MFPQENGALHPLALYKYNAMKTVEYYKPISRIIELQYSGVLYPTLVYKSEAHEIGWTTQFPTKSD